MAEVKQNGIVVNPSSGSGDTTLQVKAEVANRGNRVAQTATFEVEAVGVAEKKQFVANHLPAAEFIQFDNTSPAVDKGGGAITLTGKSNTTKITFSKGSGDIIAADISAIQYQANGSNATSGTAIIGDPGAKAKYSFSLTLTAAANDTIEARTQQIIATAAGGQKATATLNQTAGDPFLEVTPETIDISQEGTAVQVTVDTNTTFTVTPKA
nr:MAG TPA: hypothetical protein [Herelleviridae sp.]